jgi:hypothetical protein
LQALYNGSALSSADSRKSHASSRASFSPVAGGKVLIRVPDYGSINRRVTGTKWCGWRFPDHVNYFTNESLRTLTESVGYAYRRKNWLSRLDDNIIAELTRP